MNSRTWFVRAAAILRMAVFLSAAILFQGRVVFAQPSVSGCGTITGSAVWDSANLYVLDGCGVTIEAGASLTIQPGTIVKLAGSHDKIIVNGELVVAGSPGSPVVLTSLRDDGYGGDTNGDGAASVPAPGDWGWVLFNAGSRGTIEHAVLGYGGVGYHGYTHWAMVKVYGTSDVVIDHTTLQKSWSDAFYAENASVSVTNSRIAGNGVFGGSYGLKYNGLDPDTALVITDNLFETEKPGESAAQVSLGNHPGEIHLLRNSATGAGWNGLVLEGTVQRDLGLDVDDAVPLIVSTSISVAAEATLTVSPGAIFKPTGCGGKVIVDGTMLARGTAESPIVFTSIKDDSYGNDTNGDGGATTPEPNDWGYVRFTAGAEGAFDHAFLGYGGVACSGYDNYSMLQAYDADVSLERVTLAQSWGNGLFAENSSVSVRQSRILGDGQFSGSAGLYYNGLAPDLTLEISDSAFETSSPIQAAVRLTLGDHPAEIVMRNNGATGSGWNGIVLGGTVQRDLTLDVSESVPLIVAGSIAVAADAMLTLAPGTVFKPTGCGGKLVVDGTLVAQGTAAAPIVFTSLKDDTRGGDTNGDGAASAPQPADWGYVRFNSASTGTLDHLFFGYGCGGCSGYDTYAMFTTYDAIVNVEDTTFDAYRWNAVYSAEARLTIHNSRFASGLPENPMAIRNAGTRLWVDARHNWWGDASGPYHPSLNAAASGAPVTDKVWFLPWAVDESGTEVNQVLVDGPTRVSPGDTVEYAVSYYAAEPATQAVLVLALPRMSRYVDSTAGGIHWPERGQVFWKLGDLPAEASDTLAARVRFRWGIPSSEDGALARFGDTVSSDFDVSEYLAFSAMVPPAMSPLSETEIDAERSASPEFDRLYEQSTEAGFERAGAARLALNEGNTIIQIVFVRRGEVVFLRKQGEEVWASAHTRVSNRVFDAEGGMEIDRQLQSVTYTGGWTRTARVARSAPEYWFGQCMRNCILLSLRSMDATGQHIIEIFEGSPKCKFCYEDHLPSACDACGVQLDVAGVPDAAMNEQSCVTACRFSASVFECAAGDTASLCDTYDSSSSYVGPFYRVFKCDTTTGAMVYSYTFPCLSGQRCIPGSGGGGPGWQSADCIECRPPPETRSALVSGRRIEAVDRARAGDCGTGASTSDTCAQIKTEVRVARDPNAKSGPAGDVIPGQEITYAVEYENVGEGRAYGVYVTDELSPHLDETTLELNGEGEFFASTRTILWDIGELAPKGEEGSKGERTFTIHLKPGLASGTVITNQAIVYFPSVPEETATNTVVNVVQPLAAIPQSLETDYGTPVAVTLGGRDVIGTPLTYAIQEGPVSGELTGTAPTLSYTPAENFTGQDRFTFAVSNGVSESRPADVTILVQPSAADTIPPEVVWTYPEDGAVLDKVPADPIFTDEQGSLYVPSVLVGFSEAMDPNTITSTAVSVRDSGDRDIAAFVSWDGTTNQAVLVPREPWQDGNYTATVTTDLRDASGNPLESEFVWSFRVDTGAVTCAGDCDGSGDVMVNELIRGVNIALGTMAVTECPSFDTNGDGQVTVNELIAGVNNALGGCM